MAAISKVGTPTISTIGPCNGRRVGSNLFAGETIGAGDPCYIKASDGLVYRSTGAAANAAAKVRGWAAAGYVAGDPVTLYEAVEMRYGSGMTPGADVFLGATAAALADAASTGGTAPIGFVVDATRISV